MPELPEVETVCRGIAPYLISQQVSAVVIRQAQLRWKISEDIQHIVGQVFCKVLRRGKYILLETTAGTAIFHLGMSGSLRIVTAASPVLVHDHVDIVLANQHVLRFHDPRRFGALLWTTTVPNQHPLLQRLGVEPLTRAFHGAYLAEMARGRTTSVKQFIMDSQVVVGVGNIYANEALYAAGIHPNRSAKKISLERYQLLAAKIKQILRRAIARGGTTLRDFVDSQGQPGYFKQELAVYGRAHQPCKQCHRRLKEIRLGQRSTVYCSACQR